MMKAIAVISACCALLSACAFVPTTTTLYSTTYATQGDTMYFLKTTTLMGPESLPIFERGKRSDWNEVSTLMALDMRGGRDPQPVAKYEVIPKDEQPNGGYPYIELNGDSVPRIWRDDALRKRLVKTAGVGCAGELKYDKQDSRVLWLYCSNEEIAYRFDPPYGQPCMFRVGPAGGMERIVASGGVKLHTSPDFYSKAGNAAVFAWIGWKLYELDGCSNTSAIEIEGLVQHDGGGPWGAHPVLPPDNKALVGITSDLRIYQTFREGVGTEVVVEQPGKEMRRFPSPPLGPDERDMGSSKKYPVAHYIAESNLVIWKRRLLGTGEREVVYTLDLNTGKTRKAVIP